MGWPIWPSPMKPTFMILSRKPWSICVRGKGGQPVSASNPERVPIYRLCRNNLATALTVINSPFHLHSWTDVVAAAQRGFRFPRAPRHGGDAAERDADLARPALLEVERDGGGGECELVGAAVANLEVQRAPRPLLCRQREGRDDVTGSKAGFDIGRVAGPTMQRRERDRAPAT